MQGNEFAGCYNENILASANFSIKSVTGGHGVQSASFLLRRARNSAHPLFTWPGEWESQALCAVFSF